MLKVIDPALSARRNSRVKIVVGTGRQDARMRLDDFAFSNLSGQT